LYENRYDLIFLDEHIDILDSQGKKTGKSCLKSVAHKKGFYHATTHVWFYTNEGAILLQQRSASKKIHPLLWDVSAAGHVNAGESLKVAATREVKEEIGVDIAESDLIKIGVFQCFQEYDHGVLDYEFHHTYIAELKVDLSQLKIQKGEVESIKLVSINAFQSLLEESDRNGHFIASNKKYYQFVLHCILSKLSD